MTHRLVTVLASVLLLWLPFSAACVVAVPVAGAGLLAWLATGGAGAYGYTKGLLGGMDRACAGLLALDARYTVSAHCGALTRGYLRPLRAFLDVVSPGHCEGAARKEGLLDV